MKQKFIKTSDEQTANLLREAGYVELAKEGNRFVFINDSNKMDFSSSDLKLNYSDKLCF